MARLKERYQKDIAPALAKEFRIKNPMAIPRLDKIVVNMGMGEAIANAKVLDMAVDELKAILGRARAKKGMFEGDLEEGELEIGQVSSLIGNILPAGVIIENLWSEFRKTWAEPLPCKLQTS